MAVNTPSRLMNLHTIAIFDRYYSIMRRNALSSILVVWTVLCLCFVSLAAAEETVEDAGDITRKSL